ncbi:MAG TPA: RraA family protein [Galbitalea sp.]
MNNEELRRRFATLTTAHVADACIRAEVPVRCAPSALQAVIADGRLVGRVIPARHVGSVDIFLEALGDAAAGSVLVVDNGGRLDESCVGDLMALEVQGARLAGIVIWGLHRDTAEIVEIGMPVFSLGAIPTGPLSLGIRPPDALEVATVGEWTVGPDDIVLGDEDGILFIPADRAEELFTIAETIRDTERRQAERIRGGDSLRSQVKFDEYLAARAKNPDLGFREHLRGVGAAIEV